MGILGLENEEITPIFQTEAVMWKRDLEFQRLRQ